MNRIILNNQQYTATDLCLPCIIHGHDGSGASQFTISLAANLVTLGKKVMFFCARSQGVESLWKELENQGIDKVVTVGPGNEGAFLDLLSHQGDEFDYVIVKNIEEYSSTLLDAVAVRKNIILSGDFDTLQHIAKLRPVVSQIFFSGSNCVVVSQELPPLEKYEGYLLSGTIHGKIRLQID